jgi:hypothetical protein
MNLRLFTLILFTVALLMSCSDSNGAGDNGNTGNTGDNGDAGNTGDNGDAGNTGNTGDTEDIGDAGNTGESGDTGDTGNSGNTGDSENNETDDFDYDQDLDNDEDYDGDVEPGTAGCDVPENIMIPFENENSYMMFSFNGLINDRSDDNPQSGEGTFRTRLRGNYINVGADMHIAYLGNAYKIFITTMGIVNEEKGIINYSEIGIDFNDILDANAGGYNFLDISESEIDTNIKLYRGLIDNEGNIKKLCLEAVPTGAENSGGFYLCDTDHTYMSLNDDAPDYLRIAGNVILFDDADYLKDAAGMQCVCDNGAGGWRNCDEGVPDSYGLFRSKIESVPPQHGNYTGYIFDESKLFPGGNFDQDHAETHPEGIWMEHNYSPPPINGGLNIGSYTEEMGDGLYRFRVSIPPADSRSIGLLSRDSSKNMIIYRQQSFAHDLVTKTKYWVNAYFPDYLKKDDKITAGGKSEDVKIVAYNSTSNCVIAIGCDGHLLVTEAVGLTETEGGKLSFETELSDNTKYNIYLYHPAQAPSSCSIGSYFSNIGLEGVEFCEKE